MHNLKILSDQIDDVTTADNILRSFITPQMNQADRYQALWYARHPAYQRQPAKLLDVMRADGWTDWKSQGPPLLANLFRP